MSPLQLLTWVAQSVVLAIVLWVVAGVVDALVYELRCEWARGADDRVLFRLSPRHRRWLRGALRR